MDSVFYGRLDNAESQEDDAVKWFIKTHQEPPIVAERLPDPYEFHGLSARYGVL